MRRTLRAACVLVACTIPIAGPAAPASAQGLGFGTIEGVVRDSTGRAVSGGAITLRDERTGRRHFLRTSRVGRFEARFLTPGEYSALVEALGYIPERVEDIILMPGQRVALPVALARVQGEVSPGSMRTAPITVLGGAAAPPQDWLTSRTAAALPFDGHGLGAAALLSSRAGPLLDVEGLPASMSTLVVDGVPAAPRPRAFGSWLRAAGFSLASFDLVDLVTAAPDVEWPGAAAGYLTGFTRQGLSGVGGHLFGDWSGDALGGGTDVAAFQSYRIGGQLGGAIGPDTASFMLGAELLRSELPYESLWVSDAESARLVDALDQTFDIPLDRYARPTVGAVERFTGFGRLDLRLGRSHDLAIRGSAALLPDVRPILPRGALLVGPGPTPEARDLFGNVTLLSRFAEAMANEINVGFEVSRYLRDAGAGDPLDLDLPATTIAGARHQFGWPDELPFESELVSFYVRETVHDRRGSHSLKYGAAGIFPNYKLTWERNEAGHFVFPGVDEFLERRGLYRRASGEAPNSDFAFRQWSFFAQDTWTVSPGFEVIGGLRWVMTRWPANTTVRPDLDWQSLTGLDNRQMPSRPGHLEPVFGFSWSPGGGRDWLVRGSVVVDGQLVSPDVVAELDSNSGRVDVYAGVGDLGSWPAPPDTLRTPNQGHTLTLVGPKFRGARTTRVAGGISRTLGGFAAVDVTAVMRQTGYLPRRRDVNLLPRATSSDQHGRPVYGTLTKLGGLVVSEPGTNRRVVEYERVWALESAAQSTYRGVTVTLRRPLIGAFSVFASYTASRTEDDWLIGDGQDPDAQVTPFPDSLDGVDWADGTSDLDVPHRFVGGLELKVPGQYGPRLTSLYRFQSGYPFTPGLPDGVDVNGDGSGLNDPAFIDTGIAGTDGVVAAWPCLSDQVGRFAERNSCRGPELHALDARLSVDIVRSGRYSAALTLDGLNLLSSDFGEVDRALYRIDPAASLGGNQPAGTVTIPYVVNPGFGQLRTRFAPQRVFRLGVRVSY